jgi:hypothetical protein
MAVHDNLGIIRELPRSLPSDPTMKVEKAPNRVADEGSTISSATAILF